MMLRMWERVGLTPRFGIIIVLTLIATQVLEEVVMVRLVPPPKVALYTRDWMTERTLEAVRIATVTAPERREEVLNNISTKWLTFSPLAQGVTSDANTPVTVSALRAALERKLGGSVQRVVVSAVLPDDPSHSTSGVSVVIAGLPALSNVVRDHLEEEVMVVGRMQVSLQLPDGTWIAVTEPGRERANALRMRNLFIFLISFSSSLPLSSNSDRLSLNACATASSTFGKPGMP